MMLIKNGKMIPGCVRLRVYVTTEIADILQTMCARDGISITDGIRRAISIWHIISDALNEGSRVEIISKDGRRRSMTVKGVHPE